MCGIAGIVSAESWTGETRSRSLAAMLAAIRHRGPDAEGAWEDASGHACLGFRRLAIIDLSSSGGQPMRRGDGRHVLVFNGEVYNYRELRKELEQAGLTFVGTSDTEVVLNALRHWG